MDRGFWWATVHWVAKHQPRLSDQPVHTKGQGHLKQAIVYDYSNNSKEKQVKETISIIESELAFPCNSWGSELSLFPTICCLIDLCSSSRRKSPNSVTQFVRFLKENLGMRYGHLLTSYSIYSFLVFKKFIFNWRIIALQCCKAIGFCSAAYESA